MTRLERQTERQKRKNKLLELLQVYSQNVNDKGACYCYNKILGIMGISVGTLSKYLTEFIDEGIIKVIAKEQETAQKKYILEEIIKRCSFDPVKFENKFLDSFSYKNKKDYTYMTKSGLYFDH
jgi:hypothetical protein